MRLSRCPPRQPGQLSLSPVVFRYPITRALALLSYITSIIQNSISRNTYLHIGKTTYKVDVWRVYKGMTLIWAEMYFI